MKSELKLIGRVIHMMAVLLGRALLRLVCLLHLAMPYINLAATLLVLVFVLDTHQMVLKIGQITFNFIAPIVNAMSITNEELTELVKNLLAMFRGVKG